MCNCFSAIADPSVTFCTLVWKKHSWAERVYQARLRIHITHTCTSTHLFGECVCVCVYLKHKPIFFNNRFTSIYTIVVWVLFFCLFVCLFFQNKLSLPPKEKIWNVAFITTIFQKILILTSGWTRSGHKYFHQFFCFYTHSNEQQYHEQKRNLETVALVFNITLNFPINVWKFSRGWLWACIAIFIFINNKSGFIGLILPSEQ